MKSGILTAVSLLLTLGTQAQYFGLESSEWKYNYWGLGTHGEYSIEYDRDTVLQGQNAKVFLNHRTEYIPLMGGSFSVFNHIDPYAILRFSNDSVFRWKYDQFILLYDFAAQIGDSWVADIDTVGYEACDDTLVVEVTGTGFMDVNGVQKRYIDIETISSSNTSLSGRSVEILGLLIPDPGSGQGHIYAGFVPGPSDCIPPIVSWNTALPLCYYEDSVIGVLDTTLSLCNDVEVGMAENEAVKLGVHPNPATEVLQVRSSKFKVTSLALRDVRGTMVQYLEPSTLNLELSLKGLASGIYLLQAKLEDGSSVNTKIMKR